jgi:Ca-activated chloride channel homolog
MRRTLSKTLWALALAGVTLSGCDAKKSAERGTDTSHLTGADDEAYPVTAGDRSAEPSPEPAALEHEEAKATSRRPAKEIHDRAVGPTATASGTAAQLAVPAGGMPMVPPPPVDGQIGNSEDYADYGINPMTDTAKDRLSTFAVDVDTASYAIARRKILSGEMPPPASVRVEEFVNYFRYDYAGPTDGAPFAVHMDAAPSPFTKGRHLLRVGVKAKDLSLRERKSAHLVFLVDVSGSMHSADKLELAKRAMRILVDNLKDGDTVALVTYAGSTRVVLEPTGLEKKAEIVSALEDLRAGGSTAMSSGIELAYDLAARNLGDDSVSRVIVLSDGDANVGNTGHDQILETIAGKVKEGVTLSTIGFGMGNYKDTMMEQLANKGNGNYFYIDGLNEARKVFQEQLGGTLEVVAKDVKIQVDFDPDAVKRYRLVGYENRDIADHDFRNDKVDAGEIGAGHSVTAIYEVELTDKAKSLATVRIRAKQPRGTKATEKAYAFNRDRLHESFAAAPADFRFATAVMAAAEVLRRSPHASDWTIEEIRAIARNASAGDDAERQEFIALLEALEPLRKKMAIAQ